ncbi:hypothetical protein [Haloarchaeobius baliensis]|uniref:hypothetical protein n=1 Tax=Haloarchaeobius baliensis TaxID=1670458 RepID=UPI003F885905
MFDISRRGFLAGTATAAAAAAAGCSMLSAAGGGNASGWRPNWMVPQQTPEPVQRAFLTDHAAVRELAGDIHVTMLARLGNNRTRHVSPEGPTATVRRTDMEFVGGEFDVDRVSAAIETHIDRSEGAQEYRRVEDDGPYVRYESTAYGYVWTVGDDLLGRAVPGGDQSSVPGFDATLASIANGGAETLSDADEHYAGLVDRLDAPTAGTVYRYQPDLVSGLPTAAATGVPFPAGAFGTGESVVVGPETTTVQQVHVFPDESAVEAGLEDLERREHRALDAYSQDGRFLVGETETPTDGFDHLAGSYEEYERFVLFALDVTDDDEVEARYVAGPELDGDTVAVGAGPFVQNLVDRPFAGQSVVPGDTAVADGFESSAGTEVEVEVEDTDTRVFTWGLRLPVSTRD